MSRGALVSFLLVLIVSQSCGPLPEPEAMLEVSAGHPDLSDPSARFVFDREHFTDLEDFVSYRYTRFGCPGDVVHVFKTRGPDYSGSPASFDISDESDELQPTYRPQFVRNVSVDITRTYYPETVLSSVQTDSCSFRAEAVDSSACADFDPGSTPTPTPPPPYVDPAPTPAPTPSTPAYFSGLRFYRVRDAWCAGQGRYRMNAEIEATKSHIGGVNIDLDRSMLGEFEDLLLNLTYVAFTGGRSWPYAGPDEMDPIDETQLQVNLVGTSLGLDALIGARQPRSWFDDADAQMPVYRKSIVTLRDSFSSLRTEQILIPLSQSPLIDRIRIERVRGSFQLYQIDLYRLGNRGP